MPFDAYPYGAVAFCYDELASLYSLGAIGRSKQDVLRFLSPGDRVLFVGAGRGRDALAASRLGACVTALDLAPAMLARLERARRATRLDLEVVRGDVAEHRPEALYDVVVASYFLNLFTPEDTRAMLRHLRGLVRAGGILFFADFAPAAGGRCGRVATALYYRPLNWIAWALGFCALHPIPDYPELLAAEGLELVDVRRFPVGPWRDPAFWSVVARTPTD